MVNALCHSLPLLRRNFPIYGVITEVYDHSQLKTVKGAIFGFKIDGEPELYFIRHKDAVAAKDPNAILKEML